jgi:hypothetical protein
MTTSGLPPESLGRPSPGRVGVALLVLLAGCGPGRKPLVYEDEQGFRITPPPGWSERIRPAAAPGGAAKGQRGKGQANVPLPPLGGSAGGIQERLLARYDRLTAGRQAWLRVTAADVAPSLTLEGCLSDRAPRPAWRRESGVESLEVAGRPAARVAFAGRWDNQDYVCETTAVRKGQQMYFITASFPASDATAREQVRQSVAGATWR